MQALFVDLADPWELPTQLQPDDRVVVVDLFRATSTIQILVDRGCEIIPLARPPEGASSEVQFEEHVMRVGEWLGDKPPGFVADNSPTELLHAELDGKRVEFLSSNGSGTILAAQSASLVVCASLFNEDAVVDLIVRTGGRWWLTPAGCRGDRRIEDDYVCARLGARLRSLGVQLGRRAIQLVEGLEGVTRAELESGPGAQFLVRSGLTQDLDFIFDSGYCSELVPTLVDGRLRGMREERVAASNA